MNNATEIRYVVKAFWDAIAALGTENEGDYVRAAFDTAEAVGYDIRCDIEFTGGWTWALDTGNFFQVGKQGEELGKRAVLASGLKRTMVFMKTGSVDACLGTCTAIAD